MEEIEKAKEREQRNKKTSYMLMVVFGIILILGVVLLVLGINKPISSGSSNLTDMITKVLLCLLGGVLTIGGGLFFILTVIMLTTKFDGKSRNPINNFFKDTVSEMQDMFDDNRDTLAPKRRGKKICPDCGQENDKDETICIRCGGGLGE